MAGLMRDADVAIGAGGTSSWERCCLGLPSIVVLLADNQRPSAQALEQAGAAAVVSSCDEIGPALAALIRNPEHLQMMAAAAFGVCDGAGASRVIAAMRGEKIGTPPEESIHLRPATSADSELLWLWRNDPVTRAASRTSEPIAWADHTTWLAAVLAGSTRHLFIAEAGGEPVGVVRFDALPVKASEFEISINVRPDARGSGAGRAILSAACADFAAEHGAAQIHATVHQSNAASRRLFESCGFVLAGNGADGFLCYIFRTSAAPKADRSRS
jgi:L-amino acid N-acyltransferase YncA